MEDDGEGAGLLEPIDSDNVSGGSTSASVPSPGARPISMEEFAAMSPPERARHMEKIRQYFEAMSQEQRVAIMRESKRRIEAARRSGQQLFGISPSSSSSPTEEAGGPASSRCRSHHAPRSQHHHHQHHRSSSSSDEPPSAASSQATTAPSPTIVTTQPQAAETTEQSDASSKTTNMKKTRNRESERRFKESKIKRAVEWKRVRSLHFKSGHWAAPIRFHQQQKQWKYYATMDKTFGPWQQHIRALSIDVRTVKSQDDAEDILERIESERPHICALQGISGAFAALIMKNKHLRSKYWLQFGHNLTAATGRRGFKTEKDREEEKAAARYLRTVGSIVVLSRIAPISAESLHLGLGFEALRCSFVVNGSRLLLATALAPPSSSFERRNAIAHLLKHLLAGTCYTTMTAKAREGEEKKNHTALAKKEKHGQFVNDAANDAPERRTQMQQPPLPCIILAGDLECLHRGEESEPMFPGQKAPPNLSEELEGEAGSQEGGGSKASKEGDSEEKGEGEEMLHDYIRKRMSKIDFQTSQGRPTEGIWMLCEDSAGGGEGQWASNPRIRKPSSAEDDEYCPARVLEARISSSAERPISCAPKITGDAMSSGGMREVKEGRDSYNNNSESDDDPENERGACMIS